MFYSLVDMWIKYSAGLLPQCGTGASPPVQVLRGSQEVWKDWH